MCVYTYHYRCTSCITNFSNIFGAQSNSRLTSSKYFFHHPSHNPMEALRAQCHCFDRTPRRSWSMSRHPFNWYGARRPFLAFGLFRIPHLRTRVRTMGAPCCMTSKGINAELRTNLPTEYFVYTKYNNTGVPVTWYELPQVHLEQHHPLMEFSRCLRRLLLYLFKYVGLYLLTYVMSMSSSRCTRIVASTRRCSVPAESRVPWLRSSLLTRYQLSGTAYYLVRYFSGESTDVLFFVCKMSLYSLYTHIFIL